MKNEYADLHTEANRLEKQIEQAMKQFDQIAVEKTNMQQDIEQVMLSKPTNGTTLKFSSLHFDSGCGPEVVSKHKGLIQ